MKRGKELGVMLKELERMDSAKRDFVAPTPQLQVYKNGDFNLKVGDQGSFQIGEVAHGQLAERLKIPKKYYDRMRVEAPKLLEDNINYWFTNKPEDRMVRTLDNRARAFLSSGYRPLDNLDLSRASFEALSGIEGIEVKSSEITESRVYFQIITTAISFEVKVGDVVQAGIVISNSEVGMGSVKVEPMIYRLVCSNGMIAPDRSLNRYHIGRQIQVNGAEIFFRDETRRADDRAFWMKVKDVVRGSFNRDVFEGIAKRATEATQERIDGRLEKVVEVTKDRFNLQEREQSDILKHLIDGGELSRWGMVNAVTRSAHDVDDYDRSIELQRIGGEVLELPKTQWEEIATAK